MIKVKRGLQCYTGYVLIWDILGLASINSISEMLKALIWLGNVSFNNLY